MMARFFSFWRNLLRRSRVERRLDDEMQAFVDAVRRVTGGEHV